MSETKITETKTWLPLGLVITLTGLIAVGAWYARAELASIAESSKDLSHALEIMNLQNQQAFTTINDDLRRRTFNRWDADMESDSWRSFERLNADKGLIVPDVEAIKRNRDTRN